MNPFIYPKSLHVRTETPPQYSNYKKYKPFLRLEFSRKCVYCRMPDTMRGTDAFGVDHYLPKKPREDLTTDYTNLYYCCNACNSRKGDFLPSKTLPKVYIPNPCDHIMFGHLQFQRERINSKSDAGAFAVELLELNESEVVDFRRLILDSIATFQQQRHDAVQLLEQFARKVASGEIPIDDAEGPMADRDEDITRLDANLARLCGT